MSERYYGININTNIKTLNLKLKPDTPQQLECNTKKPAQ